MGSSKLFVGGLSWGTTDEGLFNAFEAHGNVREAKVILDRETGRSKGFGFVSFEREEDAIVAKAEMDGMSLDGRNIRVDVAEDKAPRGNRSGPPRREPPREPEIHRRGEWESAREEGGNSPNRRYR